nr:MAG TPA: hypothetical protein [Caudoviricetes sp.]
MFTSFTFIMNTSCFSYIISNKNQSVNSFL